MNNTESATGESTASRTTTIDELISAMLRALQLVRTLDTQAGYNMKLGPEARQQICAAIMAGQRLQLEFHCVDQRDMREVLNKREIALQTCASALKELLRTAEHAQRNAPDCETLGAGYVADVCRPALKAAQLPPALSVREIAEVIMTPADEGFAAARHEAQARRETGFLFDTMIEAHDACENAKAKLVRDLKLTAGTIASFPNPYMCAVNENGRMGAGGEPTFFRRMPSKRDVLMLVEQFKDQGDFEIIASFPLSWGSLQDRFDGVEDEPSGEAAEVVLYRHKAG